MALKRFVNGAAGEFFFQKRAPENRPDFAARRDAVVPVRPDRRRDRPRRRRRAGLGRQPRLHRPQPAPGPGRRPRPPRRAAGRPRPGARACRGRRSATSRSSRARRSTASGSSAGRRRPARAGSTSTSGSSARWTFPEVRRAALALARDVERRAPTIATSKWWKEERHGVFLDYNQNAKDRTVASAYSVRPTPDARVSMPLTWDEVADRRGGGLHARDGAGAATPSAATRAPGSTTAVGSLEALLELSARHEAEGLGDAPWPPNYRKQAGEPPRVQPSKQRRADADYDTPEAEAEREKSRAAMERRFAAGGARTRGRRRAGTRPTPTGRRRSSIPVIEIARAARKDDALAGLERWKARWPKAAAARSSRPTSSSTRCAAARRPGPGSGST